MKEDIYKVELFCQYFPQGFVPYENIFHYYSKKAELVERDFYAGLAEKTVLRQMYVLILDRLKEYNSTLLSNAISSVFSKKYTLGMLMFMRR